MSIRNKLKENKLIIVALIAYLITFIYKQDLFIKAIKNTGLYLKEMLEVMPAVFIVSALISVWVPKEIITKNFGKDSGFKGKLISVFIGSISAGPIYAAFPITQSLLFKGTSISNVIIIISAWAVVKIRMLIVESKFLGVSFSLTRYLLTIPAILILGMIAERLISPQNVIDKVNYKKEDPELEEKVVELLPGFNCGSCNYNSCSSYAKAIVNDNEEIDKCTVGGKELKIKLGEALGYSI